MDGIKLFILLVLEKKMGRIEIEISQADRVDYVWKGKHGFSQFYFQEIVFSPAYDEI